MKKISLLFKTLLLSLLFSFGQAQADESAVQALSQSLGTYTTYQANFQQSSYSKKNGAQKSQGKVYMMRPGKFRWETTHPYEQTVIANGNTLWIYDVDLKQASQQSLAQRGFNPGELLTRPVEDLTQQFTITQENGWFKLVPKKAGDGFKEAYLQFQNNKLTGLKIINQLNQTNTFSFSQIQINPKLSPGLFQFKAPPGVQMLKGKK